MRNGWHVLHPKNAGIVVGLSCGLKDESLLAWASSKFSVCLILTNTVQKQCAYWFPEGQWGLKVKQVILIDILNSRNTFNIIQYHSISFNIIQYHSTLRKRMPFESISVSRTRKNCATAVLNSSPELLKHAACMGHRWAQRGVSASRLRIY